MYLWKERRGCFSKNGKVESFPRTALLPYKLRQSAQWQCWIVMCTFTQTEGVSLTSSFVGGSRLIIAFSTSTTDTPAVWEAGHLPSQPLAPCESSTWSQPHTAHLTIKWEDWFLPIRSRVNISHQLWVTCGRQMCVTCDLQEANIVTCDRNLTVLGVTQVCVCYTAACYIWIIKNLLWKGWKSSLILCRGWKGGQV